MSYEYDKLTWPEIAEAADRGAVTLLPVGSTEQHGHHLPLDVDNFLARSVCLRAAALGTVDLLVLPTVSYGYNEHAMDFPGTVHISYDTFISYCTDICKSVAHAGFDRIVIVDGHGSNEHLCEFAARRATLESSALVASTTWWNLILDEWEAVRDSDFGGCAHACELETSAYLHLAPEFVDLNKARDEYGGAIGHEASPYLRIDLVRGRGPVKLVRWTSIGSETGVTGAPSLASSEKGEVAIGASAKNLAAFCEEFRAMSIGQRRDHRNSSLRD